MNHIFKPLIYRRVVAIYMDDILVFTEMLAQHKQVIKEVLDILHQNNLFLKPEKCVFEQPEVDYKDDKLDGLLNSHNIILLFTTNLEQLILRPTFCRGRQTLTRGRTTIKTPFYCHQIIFAP